MITLNTDKLSIYVPREVYDVPLYIKMTVTGQDVGSITISSKDSLAFVISLTLLEPSELLAQEALLSLSQYLMHRHDIIAIDTSSVPFDLPFEEESEFITQTSINDYAFSQPLVRVAIVMMENTDGELLMGYRPEGYFMPRLWEFPGGKIEPGETPEQAGIRELSEELGINLNHIEDLITLEYAFLSRRLEAHLMRSTNWEGVPKALHHTDLIWVKPDVLERYAMPLSSILFLPEVLSNTTRLIRS
jgi:8-oxo-dGTP diphosphatase